MNLLRIIQLIIRNVLKVLKKGLKYSFFFDVNNLLSVGGRIDLAKVDYDKGHPIILAAKSYFCKLVTADAL